MEKSSAWPHRKAEPDRPGRPDPNNCPNPQEKKPGFLWRLLRLGLSWFGLTGLYASFSVCPFCGQQHCPVGLASSGIMGGLLALAVNYWGQMTTFVKMKFFRR